MSLAAQTMINDVGEQDATVRTGSFLCQPSTFKLSMAKRQGVQNKNNVKGFAKERERERDA